MIKSTLFSSLNRAIHEKRDILKTSFMFTARNGIWLCDNERKRNATEKNDFMIPNHFQYPGTVFINLLYTHTHTHTCYLWWLFCVKE